MMKLLIIINVAQYMSQNRASDTIAQLAHYACDTKYHLWCTSAQD